MPFKKVQCLFVKSKLILAFFLMLTVLGAAVFNESQANAAQTVPYKVNFQGRLTDDTGNILADGLYNMKFRLFTVSSGGSNVWEEFRETGDRVQVTNGLFSVQLGDVTALSPTLFTTENMYLEVELPTPATATCGTSSCASFTEGPMTPRNKLASAAYAFNADAVDGIDGEDLARVDQGNTFIGDQLFQSTSTTALRIQKADGTGNLFIADTTNGRIGIGRVPTQGTLDVQGTIYATSNVIAGTIYGVNKIGFSGTSLNDGRFTKGFGVGTGGITNNAVVVLNTAAANVIQTTTARDSRVIGVSTATASSGGGAEIAIAGNYSVTADTGAVALGDQLVTSTTSGQVTVDNNATTGILGYALSTKTAGSSGLVSVNIRPVGGQSSPIFRNAADSATAFQVQNAAGTSNLFIADTTNSKIGINMAPVSSGAALQVSGSISATGSFSGSEVLLSSQLRLGGGGYISKIITAGAAGLTMNQIVIIANESSNARATTTTTPRDTRVYGIVKDTVAGGGNAVIVISGNYPVTVRTADAVSIGDQLVTSDTAGAATVDNNATTGILGIALAAKSAGVAGTVNVAVNVNGGQSAPIFRNTSDSTAAFQIQNAAGTSNLFVANTSNNIIGIGRAPVVGNGSLQIESTGSADGLSVYNSTTKLFSVNNSCGLQSYTTGCEAWTNFGTNNDATKILSLFDSDEVEVASVSGTGAVYLQNSTDSTAAFQIQDAAGTSNLFVADTTNSRIGIGILTPAQTLDVYKATGTGVIANFRIQASTADVQIGSNSGQTPFIRSGSGDTFSISANGGNDQILIDTDGSVAFKNTSNSTTAFEIQNAAGTSNLFIADTTNSRIGIGTASPGATLGIKAQTGVTDFKLLRSDNSAVGLSISIDPSATIYNSSGNLRLTSTGGGIQVGGVSGVNMPTGSDTLKVIGVASQTGNLLVLQNSTPTTVLQVSASGAVLSRNSANSTSAFQIQNAAGTSNLFVADTTNTRVGIGNNAPSYTFDVTGDINTSASLRTGGTTRLDNAGALQNITGFAQSSGNFAQSGSGSFSTGTGLVSLNGDTTIAAGRSLTANGTALFKNGTDSATAFQIQNAAGSNVMTVNNVSSNISFGEASLVTSPALDAFGTTTSTTAAVERTNAVAAKGYMFMAGGNNGGTAVATTYSAPINGDGTVGTWTSRTALPAARRNAKAVTDGNYIWVIGGNTNDTASNAVNTVYKAALNSDGTIGTWSTTTVLPADRDNHGAVYANGYVYVYGGRTDAGATSTTVYYSAVNPADGTLGAWTTSGNSMPAGRYRGASVTNGEYIYYLGGTAASREDEVYYASINPSTGAVGSWGSGTVLPAALTYVTGEVIGDYIYLLGGEAASGSLATTQYAQINGDGSIGSWTSTSSMPAGRDSNTAVTDGTYIYSVGGWNTSAQSSVYYSKQQTSGTESINIDLTTNRLGIGNNSPDTELEVTGGLCVSDSAADNCATGAGQIRADGAITANAFDLAELYGSTQSIPAGTLVTVDKNNPGYVKPAEPGDTLVGVISTEPGFVLGFEDNPMIASAPFKVRVALVGRVPVKVSGEQGSIAIGDRIALSENHTGRGIKASGGDPTVGIALEAFNPSGDDSMGTIEVFVNLNGGNTQASDLVQDTAGDIQGGGDVDLTSLNVTGPTTLQGLTVSGDAVFEGTVTVKKLVIEMDLIIEGKIISSGPQPMISVGNAFQNPTNVQVMIDGTDTAGTITISTGDQTGQGVVSGVTFSEAYQQPPRVSLTPANDNASSTFFYFERTLEGFELITTEPLEAGKSYIFDYLIIGAEGSE